MPRGRPPMKCESIDEKTFGRKTQEFIEKAQKTKCVSRMSHATKPCKRVGNKCVSSTKDMNTPKKLVQQVIKKSNTCEKAGKNVEVHNLKQGYFDTDDAVISRFTKRCENTMGENGQPCKTTLNMLRDKISCKGSELKSLNMTCKQLFADKKKMVDLTKSTFKQKQDLCKQVGKDNKRICAMKSVKKGCVETKSNKNAIKK